MSSRTIPKFTPWNSRRSRVKSAGRILHRSRPCLEALEDKVPPALSITSFAPPAVMEGAVVSNAVITTFTDSNSGTQPGEYAAQVTWGDGETSNGSVAVNAGGGFKVSADKPHPFARMGYYPITVTISDRQGGSTPADHWVGATAMPAARFEFAAVEGSNDLLYAMGGYGSAGVGNSVVAYNPITKAWTTMANLPTARSDLAAASGPDGRIYAVGGFSLVATPELSALNQVYTPGTNSWANAASMPTARAYQGAAAGLDGRIYAIGGFDGVSNNYTAGVYAYAPATNNWTSVAGMPTARGYLAVVQGADGRIYAIGGYNSFGATSAVEAYTPSTNSWTTLASLPTPRFSSGIAVAPDGRIYVLGGYDSALGGYTSTTYVYTPATNTWLSGPALTTARGYAAAATAADGRVYALGGYGTGGALASVEALGPERSTTQASGPIRVDNMPWTAHSVVGQSVEGTAGSATLAIVTDSNQSALASHYSAAITWSDGETSAGTVTAVSGSPATFSVSSSKPTPYSQPGYYPYSATVKDGEATSTNWTQVKSLPEGRYEFAVASGSDGRIYALGGYGSSVSAAAYAPLTDQWTAVAAMPTGRYDLAASNGSDGRIYAIGGYVPNSGTTAKVEAYSSSDNTWSTVASMPASQYGMAATEGKDGRIYVLGGYDSGNKLSNSLFAYTPESNTWTTLAPMSVARTYLAAVTGLDGRIYAIGGLTTGGSSGILEAYTPATNTWTTLASLPVGRFSMGAGLGSDGRIYVMGGAGKTVAIYTPSTNTWSQGPDLTVDRYDIVGCAGYDGSVYALGGYKPGVGAYSTVEVLGMTPAFPATVSGYVSVSDAPLSLQQVTPPKVVEGSGVSVGLATFKDADPTSTAADFKATINWGDGEISAGLIVAAGSGNFNVVGYKPHPYAVEGDYSLSISVTGARLGIPGAWTPLADVPGGLSSQASAAGLDGRLYEFGGLGPFGVTTSVNAYSTANNSWSTVASLSTPRLDLAGARGADGRIYAIGGTDGSAALATVEAYTIATNSWAPVANMPTARYGQAATAGLDGRIYVIGGYDPSLGGYTNTVYAYTPATDTWTSVASMPTARVNLSAVTGFDGRIYAIGGAGQSGALDVLEAYTPSTNTWTTVASLPAARAAFGAAVGPDGRIYVLGGSSSVAVYSPATNTWSNGPALTKSRGWLSAAAGADGNIYAVGGYSSQTGLISTAEVLGLNQSSLSVSTNVVFIDSAPNLQSLTPPTAVEGAAVGSTTVATFTSPDSNATAADFLANIGWGDGTSSVATVASNGTGGFAVTASKPQAYAEQGSYTFNVSIGPSGWKPVADLPAARFEMAAAQGNDGRFYVLGGVAGAGATATAAAYTPTSDVWTAVASMPTARLDLGAAAGSDGRIYALGGSVPSVGTTATVEAYTPGTNSWATVASMPMGRWGLASATDKDGRIYAFGGYDSQGVLTSLVYAYTPATNTWATVANMPTPRYYVSAIAIPDGRILVLGGLASGESAKVEAYTPSTNTWSTLASLPVPLYGMGVALGVDGKVYVLGGYSSALGGYSNSFYVYTPSSNTWSTGLGLSSPRAFLVGGTASDGNIYSIGGYSGSGASSLVEVLPLQRSSLNVTGFLNVADAPLTLLSLTPPSPIAGVPTGLVDVTTFTDADPAATTADYLVEIDWGEGQTWYDVGTVRQGDGMFIVRARKPQPYASAGTYPFTIVIQDRDGENVYTIWQGGSGGMPSRLYAQAAAQGPDGKIYEIGGMGLTGIQSTVWAYPSAYRTWMARASLATPRYDLAAVMGSDGRIYALGGMTASGATASVEAYSTSTNTWTSSASLPTARYAHAAVTAQDGRTYVLGGNDPSLGGYTNSVYAYSPGTKSWTTVASMLAARSYFAAATGVDGRIYVFGGYGPGGTMATAEAYNPANNSWTALAPMPSARFGMGIGVAADGRIFVVGGYDLAIANYTTSVLVYNPGTNTWTNGPSLMTASGYLAAVVDANGNLHALGGWNSESGLLSSHQQLAFNHSQITATGTVVVSNPPGAPPAPGALGFSNITFAEGQSMKSVVDAFFADSSSRAADSTSSESVSRRTTAISQPTRIKGLWNPNYWIGEDLLSFPVLS